MKYDKPLLLIVGASGSGKTTIVETLEKKYGLKTVQSYSTRKQRYEGETGHTFITENEYDKLPNKVAHTFYNGHRYCTTEDQLDKVDTYVVDTYGVITCKNNYHNKRLVVIVLTVNPFVRAWRMFKRKDGLIKILSRLRFDHNEFKGIKNIADYVIKNEETDDTVAKILTIWRTEIERV